MLAQLWSNHLNCYMPCIDGGYPVVYLDYSEQPICSMCATEDAKSEYDWDNPISAFVHWEGDSIFCDGCNFEIESAYGVPDLE